jgi:hypothetical protein
MNLNHWDSYINIFLNHLKVFFLKKNHVVNKKYIFVKIKKWSFE